MKQSVIKLSVWALNRVGVLGTGGFASAARGNVNVPANVLITGRRFASSTNPISASASTTANQQKVQTDYNDDEFRTLDLIKSNQRQFQRRKRRERKEVPPPRYLKMPEDQDWPSVWPTAKTFHPASVPLPLHQGYVPPHKTPPGKFGNLELMKIPNFLHLTPPAIKRHCEALKKFCTPWPEELKNDYALDQLFPIEVVTSDYCHSSPSIRDIRARIVTFQVKLSFLNLDYHGKDKFLRLAGERYDPKTDVLTIVTECCPLRQQNYDYAMYLLTALYHESMTQESWEEEKEEADMEKYVWEGSVSQKTVDKILGISQGEGDPVPLIPTLEKYKDAVTDLHNQGEDVTSVEEYGKSVRELFNLPVTS